MKSSIKRLRAAYEEYMEARSARYYELADWDPRDDDALAKHNAVAARIELEESALMRQADEPVLISVHAYITDDILYRCHYDPRTDEKMFDLT